LASNDLDAQTRMSVPLQRVKLDVPNNDWLVQVWMFHRVRVCVTVEHL